MHKIFNNIEQKNFIQNKKLADLGLLIFFNQKSPQKFAKFFDSDYNILENFLYCNQKLMNPLSFFWIVPAVIFGIVLICKMFVNVRADEIAIIERRYI